MYVCVKLTKAHIKHTHPHVYGQCAVDEFVELRITVYQQMLSHLKMSMLCGGGTAKSPPEWHYIYTKPTRRN